MLNAKLYIKNGFIKICLIFIILWFGSVNAQAYSSGSTGADGAFAPTANITLTMPASGVFNFTTVNIPAGVTVTFTPNAANTPVTILATGDVIIVGAINVNGSSGLGNSTTALFQPGGAGGPGGFPGGQGGARGTTNNYPSSGQGPGGGTPNIITSTVFEWGSYGAPGSFVGLVPLFGGSGGAGSNGSSSQTGASGGGGGGAIVISSSTKISLNGTVSSNGGADPVPSCYGPGGPGGGSGGAIRLVAPSIDGSGAIQAIGTPYGYCGAGNPGRIRLEALSLTFNGSVNPQPSISISPGPVTGSSNPALTGLPSLTFSSIGTTPTPSTPTGSFTTADVSLPQGTTNPVTVTLSAVNIPVGTVFTLNLLPQFNTATSVNTPASTGTVSNSTASVSLNFPSGQISVLNAYANFTLPAQVAMLYPLIDGEPVDRVMVAANYGQASEVTFFTKSGKEMKADRLFRDLR